MTTTAQHAEYLNDDAGTVDMRLRNTLDAAARPVRSAHRAHAVARIARHHADATAHYAATAADNAAALADTDHAASAAATAARCAEMAAEAQRAAADAEQRAAGWEWSDELDVTRPELFAERRAWVAAMAADAATDAAIDAARAGRVMAATEHYATAAGHADAARAWKYAPGATEQTLRAAHRAATDAASAAAAVADAFRAARYEWDARAAE